MHSEHCAPGTLDKLAFGPALLAFWKAGMQRALVARRRIGEHRFIDICNSDVVARPVETFRRLYERLGFELPLKLASMLEDYNRRNAPEAAGKHRYFAQEYGLTDAHIRSAFADYIERFQL